MADWKNQTCNGKQWESEWRENHGTKMGDVPNSHVKLPDGTIQQTDIIMDKSQLEEVSPLQISHVP